MTYDNSDAPPNSDANHPSLGSELGCRLEATIALYKTKREAADVACISPDQLTRYVKGQNAAPFEVMARLARGKGVSLDWLATGEGRMLAEEAKKMPASTTAAAEHDADLVGRILEEISAVYKELGWAKSLYQLGVEAAQIADDIATPGQTAEEKAAAIRTAGSVLRRHLRNAIADPAAATSTKSRA